MRLSADTAPITSMSIWLTITAAIQASADWILKNHFYLPECGYDGAFTTEIFQLPSMEGAAKGRLEYLIPIMKKVYGQEEA